MSWKAKRFKRNKHHLTPKSRGGKDSRDNMLLIKVKKHNLLHKIFGNRTWEEIIQVMIRVAEMKGRKRQLREINGAS